MFFYPHEQFLHAYLLLISAAILLAFAGLKMANRRAVWLLSISAPGILLLPDYFLGAFALHQREALPVSIILGGALLHFFLSGRLGITAHFRGSDQEAREQRPSGYDECVVSEGGPARILIPMV